MTVWAKSPTTEGYYWYEDQHVMPSDGPIVVQVHVDVEGISVSYHDGECWPLDDIIDDLPWFFGPLAPPEEVCPGPDGYYTYDPDTNFPRFNPGPEPLRE